MKRMLSYITTVNERDLQREITISAYGWVCDLATGLWVDPITRKAHPLHEALDIELDRARPKTLSEFAAVHYGAAL
jgi:hypothetical protein